MNRKPFILFFSFLASAVFYAFPQSIKEYNNAAILSFETMPDEIAYDKHSSLSLSQKHFKHINHSLRWDWNSKDASWSIKKHIGYKKRKTADDARISTFACWVYAEKPIKDGQLRIAFLKNDSVQCFFDYKLEFSGWRGMWVAFERDMQGTPVEEMDEVRFSVNGSSSNTLFFDHIILSSMQDVRHHTADFQAPYINKSTRSHWLILLQSWVKDFDTPLNNSTSLTEKNGAEIIEKRLETLLLKGKKARSINRLQKSFNAYRIALDEDENIRGLPLFFERYGETYEYLGAPRYNKIYDNPMGLRSVNRTLLDLAATYHLTTNNAIRKRAEAMFVLLSKHMLDQGFQAGSAMGTLHHLGYSMRDFYPAMFLMRNVLKENQLKETVQKAMEWFAGTGEVKTDTRHIEMDIDAFNTNLVARLASILMIDDNASKTRYLHAFSHWVDNGYKYAEGTRGSFKSDGSIYHHRHNYPAYAVGGLTGAVNAVCLLKNTPFKISEESHQILKDALLSMRLYCNLRTWCLSLSGRHPDGKKELNPAHFGILALAGSPDGVEEIDTELATAYLRLVKKPSSMVTQFKQLGLTPESSPVGNWSFPYSCLSVHRQSDWMVAAMGHSRYLWASEIYRGENMFGRYLTHGSLQILATGNPISNEGSGFRQAGWDWNHFPGTTATVLPIKALRANVRNLDAYSGFEEMLLSDETFAGGISLQQMHGAFGMKLHEHDKYNGSLRARKSVFFFDNRIVALGSNIESALPESTQTTLFQVYLDSPEKPFFVNGKTITEFPYRKTIQEKQTILSDGLNNYFFIRNGVVEFGKSEQHSLDEETEKPTQNNFALAAINHGGNPKNGRYEYMALVQPSTPELNTFLESNVSPYIILQHDSMAHIVSDKATKITGYVLFEAGKPLSDKLLVKNVDTPCLIMTNESTPDALTISVADPDLRFYEGKSDDMYDKNGKRIERSVYSRDWINNPSNTSKIRITVAGKWILKNISKSITLFQHKSNETVLSITCREGKGQEFELERK